MFASQYGVREPISVGRKITPSAPGRIWRAMFSTLEMSAGMPPPKIFASVQSNAAAPHCTVPQTW